MTPAPLILASASPRRAELLRTAGIAFDVRHADVDETVHHGEDPRTYVRRVAEAKATVVLGRAERGSAVLAADTVVVVDNRILGKPRDTADARAMLTSLSGKCHLVVTGVCLANSDGGQPTLRTSVVQTTVEFSRLKEEEIDWYVASGEPMDKAGAYAIQGLASRFITRIDGSYSNVVGLPVALVYALCREAGILVS
jgi:septum formation protein